MGEVESVQTTRMFLTTVGNVNEYIKKTYVEESPFRTRLAEGNINTILPELARVIVLIHDYDDEIGDDEMDILNECMDEMDTYTKTHPDQAGEILQWLNTVDGILNPPPKTQLPDGIRIITSTPDMYTEEERNLYSIDFPYTDMRDAFIQSVENENASQCRGKLSIPYVVSSAFADGSNILCEVVDGSLKAYCIYRFSRMGDVYIEVLCSAKGHMSGGSRLLGILKTYLGNHRYIRAIRLESLDSVSTAFYKKNGFEGDSSTLRFESPHPEGGKRRTRRRKRIRRSRRNM